MTLCATILTSFTSLILLTVVIWEAGERWQASKSDLGDHQPGPGNPRVHQPWEPYEDLKRLNTKMKAEIIGLTRNTYDRLCRLLWRIPTAFRLRRTDPSDDLDLRELEGMELPSAANFRPDKEVPTFKMSLNISKSSLSSQNAEARPPPQRQFSMPSGGHHNLKSLKASGEIFPESSVGGPVRDLRFAPNGKWLAASFEHGTGLWEVRDGFTWHRDLDVNLGYLSWSPDSSCLVTTHKKGGQLWTSEPKVSQYNITP